MTLIQTTPNSAMYPDPVAGIRSLMVHVETAPETLPRLDVAVDLAHRFGAVLFGAGVEAFPLQTQAERLFPGETVLELQKALDDDLRRAEAIFRTRTAGLWAEWRAAETLPGPELARLSRAADLIVAGGAPIGRGAGSRVADTADLVMLSGRPVLVAPPTGGRLRGEAVVVAWKDTREARRAVADAMAFLKLAEEVVVIQVSAEDSALAAKVHTADVVQFLQRHGIPARAKVLIEGPEGVAAALSHQARILDADLIVAGAYGRARLAQWVFGGVTHDLLRTSDRFVLLSH